MVHGLREKTGGLIGTKFCAFVRTAVEVSFSRVLAGIAGGPSGTIAGFKCFPASLAAR
jgi:hypothetical protein